MRGIMDFRFSPPDNFELFAFICFILFLIVIYILFTIKLKRTRNRFEKEQVFLYKEKKLGLSTLEVKIINFIMDAMGLDKTTEIIQNSKKYEDGVERFVRYLERPRNRESLNLHNDSPQAIAEEIVLIHEKLFHKNPFSVPLENIQDLDKGTFLCLIFEGWKLEVGRFDGLKDNYFIVLLARAPKSIREMAEKEVKVIFWRQGDSNYAFDARIAYVENRIIYLNIPDTFSRGKEVKLPVIELTLPCLITFEKEEEPDKKHFAKGIIKYLKENEAQIFSETDISQGINFQIKLDIQDFSMHITAQLKEGSFKKDKDGYLIGFDFLDISEIAKNVIRLYLAEVAA